MIDGLNESFQKRDARLRASLFTEDGVFIFIDVTYNATHWPYRCPDEPSTARDNARHLGPSDEPTSTRADYVAMLERADQGIGRILEAIDKSGLRRNTIVIFTNDNGGEWLSRNTPQFHHKGSVWEGGIRVPAIIRWPGSDPGGPRVGPGRDHDGPDGLDPRRHGEAGSPRGTA